MTRYGMNPARNKNTSYAPSRVTAAMVTYIPNLEGYFRHRLQVLKLSLASLIHTLDGSCDIMVFSNGSCQEVNAYLEKLLASGKLHYLIRSRENLGVIGAFKILFNAAPGEIIAYSDDDVFYYPGWLPASLQILDTYPNSGMISGAPVGFSSEHALESVDLFLSQHTGEVQWSEKPRNPAWEEDWARSTGRSTADHLQEIGESPLLKISYRGVEAVKSAKHFQFVVPKEVVCQALEGEWTGSLMEGLVSLDEAVDRLGYLRLSTPKRFTRHIGNAISEAVAREAESLGITLELEPAAVEEAEHWLLRIPGSGRILWPLYNWLFRVLHKVK